MRILITGGGTGGHVFPGLAVAEALRTLDPGSEILYVGTARGLEATLVPRAGVPFRTVPASGVRGLGWGARLRFAVNLTAGVTRSLALLLRWRPDVVLGTGGYVSVPVLLAARLLRRPIVVQEQNSVPGSTNRLVARWARRVYAGFASAREFFPGRDVRVTGNPVRRDLVESLAVAPEPAWDGSRPLRLLVFGGSRGARTLNDSLIGAAPSLKERDDLELWLQTGPEDHLRVSSAYAGAVDGWRETGRRLRVEAFVDDMPAALRWADLAVCRAGAMTLAEIATAGLPAILVPFPHATDDHQTRNARETTADGAADLLPDDMCNGTSLTALVAHLMGEPARLATMALAARRRARPDAAMEIALDLMRLTGALPPEQGRT